MRKAHISPPPPFCLSRIGQALFVWAGVFFLILFLPFLFTGISARAADANPTFGAESFTLQNGMQVVVIPNHRVPVITHMIWYKAGAADEPPGLSGMAHYFEHLMFKGTETMEPGAFSKTIKTLGGNDNAFTGQDFTAYYQSVSVEHLKKIMQMEADRMLHLAPPPDHYASEKNVVLEERRQRTENDPAGLLSEQVQSALFVNHPYGTPVIGWMDEIKEYEWADVKTFYDRWYAPNNAIVVVSGDITAKKLKPLAEQIYGALPAKELPARTRYSVPPAKGLAVITSRDPSVRQASVRRVYIAPSFHSNKTDSLALQVLEDILAGGPAARLYQTLVVEDKAATSVSLSYQADALDYGTIWLSATPADGILPEDMEEKINTQLRRIVSEGVTAQELADSIQRLQDQAVYARDSLSGPAMVVGRMLATGSTLEDIENWPEDIAQVTAEQVQKAASLYLNPDKPWIRPPVTGYLLPEADAEKEETADE